MVKQHCALSNEWIANCLEMGHPVGMSKVAKLFQESKEGVKQIKKCEKALAKTKDKP